MSTTGLTKTQKLLLYGLKQAKIGKTNSVSIAYCMKEEDDQLLMIHYLLGHPKATEQEILNESGRILEQRKQFTK